MNRILISVMVLLSGGLVALTGCDSVVKKCEIQQKSENTGDV